MKWVFYNLLFFYCLLFSVTNSSFAQIANDSSYIQEVQELYDSMGKYYDKDVRKTIKLTSDLLEIAEQKKDTFTIIDALHLKARRSQHITEYYLSIKDFERELRLLKAVTSKRTKEKLKTYPYLKEIEILAQLGQNYEKIGQIKKALEIYYKCVDIAEKENLEFYKVIMPTLIANLYSKTGDYRIALQKEYESFNGLKNSKRIDEINKIYNRAEISIDLSNTYLKLNRADSALWILDQGVEEKLDTLNDYSRIRFIKQRGTVYLEKNELNKALSYLVEAQKLADNYDSINGSTFYYEDLAKCYFQLKNFDSAIFIMRKGIDTKRLNAREIYLAEDYKLLAKIYKEAGNIEKSNKFYEKYIINQTELEKSKDTITTSFHNQEIRVLNDKRKAQKNKLLYVIGSISIVVFGLFLIIAYLINEKKKNAKKFNELLAILNQEGKPELEIIDTKDQVLEEKTSAEVNQNITEQILNGLEKLKEQTYFLKQDCNSYNVAKKIKTNTSYLSKVINSHFQKNFNTYINDLRINYAIIQLKNDSRFRSFSIQSIAEELGYKSVDSFTKYFKLRTGLNPSFYIKQLNSLD